MKLSQILSQREALLRQTHLANLAFAYSKLAALVRRLHRARLTGEVCLRPAEPDAGRDWAALTALECSQSVIEEHFTDEDIMELADIIAFMSGADDVGRTFRLGDLEATYLAPLRHQLEQCGVSLDSETEPAPTASEPD